MKTKRVEVTMEISIPEEWTLGETEEFIVTHLSHKALTHHRWEANVKVGMQRIAEDE